MYELRQVHIMLGHRETRTFSVSHQMIGERNHRLLQKTTYSLTYSPIHPLKYRLAYSFFAQLSIPPCQIQPFLPY